MSWQAICTKSKGVGAHSDAIAVWNTSLPDQFAYTKPIATDPASQKKFAAEAKAALIAFQADHGKDQVLITNSRKAYAAHESAVASGSSDPVLSVNLLSAFNAN